MAETENAITEKLSFETQVHEAWDGTEQRAALRSQPRRYVSYDWQAMELWHANYLHALVYSGQTDIMRFPLWHAGIQLRDKNYKDQGNIHIPVRALWPYRNIGGLLLFVDDESYSAKYDLKYLTGSGVAGLEKQLTRDWEAVSTRVVPLAYGVLQQEDSFNTYHSTYTEMTINFELTQSQKAVDFPVALDEYHDEKVPDESAFRFGLPETYLGSEVWRWEGQWNDAVSANFSRNANRIDYNTGVFRFDVKSWDPSETLEQTYLLLCREEIHNMQRFFIRQKGKWKSFWTPTWFHDIELVGLQPAGQSFLVVRFPLYYKYYQKSKRRKRLVVFYRNNTSEFLTIAGWSTNEDGTRGKVYLESPLTHSIRPADVYLISFFLRCRFDTDDLVIDYETTETATASIQFKEVDE